MDQCNDAVQITGKDSTIMVSAFSLTLTLKGIISFCHFPHKQYVNRSFLDLSGYTRDEVIGKPAMDILKTFDSKTVSVVFVVKTWNVCMYVLFMALVVHMCRTMVQDLQQRRARVLMEFATVEESLVPKSSNISNSFRWRALQSKCSDCLSLLEWAYGS